MGYQGSRVSASSMSFPSALWLLILGVRAGGRGDGVRAALKAATVEERSPSILTKEPRLKEGQLMLPGEEKRVSAHHMHTLWGIGTSICAMPLILWFNMAHLGFRENTASWHSLFSKSSHTFCPVIHSWILPRIHIKISCLQFLIYIIFIILQIEPSVLSWSAASLWSSWFLKGYWQGFWE